MGSLLSIEIFSFDIFVQLKPETESPWPYFILFFLAIFLVICLLRRCHIHFKNNRPRAVWAPPPTFMAILLIILLTTPISNARPPKKAIIPTAKKFGKVVTRTTAPLMVTTAMYFGLESLANFLQDNPEISTAILAIFGCFFLLLVHLLLKLFVTVYHFLHLRNAPPTNENYELSEIQNTLGELVQRAPPPPTSIRN